MSSAHRMRTDAEREENMASVPEVAELERDAEVLGLQFGNDGLKVVALFPLYSHVVALCLGRDGFEAEVLDDLVDDFGLRGLRTTERPLRAISKAVLTLGFITSQPGIEDLPAGSVVPAGLRRAVSDFVPVADDRRSPSCILR